MPGRQYRITLTGDILQFAGISEILAVSEAGAQQPRSFAEELFDGFFAIPSNTGAGFTSTFFAEPGETYAVSTVISSTLFQAPLDYELTLEEFDDDAVAGFKTTRSFGLGETITGDHEFLGDQDWIRLDVDPGASYLLSSNLAFGDSLFVIGIYDLTGERIDLPLVGVPDGFNANPQVGFSAREGVTYFGVVQDINGGQAGTTEDYTLSLTLLVGDAASDATTTLSVAAGGTVQSTIQGAGDLTGSGWRPRPIPPTSRR
ncbi:MAG: hypothetical protein AAFV19_20235 [Pseudomonadota bacterium]